MGTLTRAQLQGRLSSDGAVSAEPSSEDLKLYDEAIAGAEGIVCAYIGNGQPFAFGTVGTTAAPHTRRVSGDGTPTLILPEPLATFVGASNAGQTVGPSDVWTEELAVPAADDTVITGLVLKQGRWSADRQAITISGVWGWGDAPPEIVEVMLELAVRIVKGRSAGYSDVIGVGPDGTQQYTKALPALAKLVLDLARQRYRLPDQVASGGWFGAA